MQASGLLLCWTSREVGGATGTASGWLSDSVPDWWRDTWSLSVGVLCRPWCCGMHVVVAFTVVERFYFITKKGGTCISSL